MSGLYIEWNKISFIISITAVIKMQSCVLFQNINFFPNLDKVTSTLKQRNIHESWKIIKKLKKLKLYSHIYNENLR